MKHLIIYIISALLILLFSYTAIYKVIDHHNFVIQLRVSPVKIVNGYAPLLSWFVPATEAIIAGLMILDRTRNFGLWASLVLLILFETYVAGLFFSGYRLPCSCGGVISTMSWKQHIVFNAFFILINSIAAGLSLKTSRPKNTQELSRA